MVVLVVLAVLAAPWAWAEEAVFPPDLPVAPPGGWCLRTLVWTPRGPSHAYEVCWTEEPAWQVVSTREWAAAYEQPVGLVWALEQRVCLGPPRLAPAPPE